ncbi:MAG: glutaredoxin 3 [Desulfatiglans sp.]|jgi:glutaredoxin 3|nr:glutaredoxin 3 [Thermodesulfobacteriota bacterium]MEE4351600.1 glutaredoxin 3 [Desulfatiglans sp.]
MTDVEIYTSKRCVYCDRAKELLDSKGVVYREISVDKSPEKTEEAVRRSKGMKTVPQIFIDDFHVGGCDDLIELDKKGELEKLLGAP